MGSSTPNKLRKQRQLLCSFALVTRNHGFRVPTDHAQHSWPIPKDLRAERGLANISENKGQVEAQMSQKKKKIFDERSDKEFFFFFCLFERSYRCFYTSRPETETKDLATKAKNFPVALGVLWGHDIQGESCWGGVTLWWGGVQLWWRVNIHNPFVLGVEAPSLKPNARRCWQESIRCVQQIPQWSFNISMLTTVLFPPSTTPIAGHTAPVKNSLVSCQRFSQEIQRSFLSLCRFLSCDSGLLGFTCAPGNFPTPPLEF